MLKSKLNCVIIQLKSRWGSKWLQVKNTNGNQYFFFICKFFYFFAMKSQIFNFNTKRIFWMWFRQVQMFASFSHGMIHLLFDELRSWFVPLGALWYPHLAEAWPWIIPPSCWPDSLYLIVAEFSVLSFEISTSMPQSPIFCWVEILIFCWPVLATFPIWIRMQWSPFFVEMRSWLNTGYKWLRLI